MLERGQELQKEYPFRYLLRWMSRFYFGYMQIGFFVAVDFCSTVVSLRCHDGDDNENVKKAIGWIGHFTVVCSVP